MAWGEEWPDRGSLTLSVAGGHPCIGAAGMESQSLHMGRRVGWQSLNGGKGLLMKGRLRTRY